MIEDIKIKSSKYNRLILADNGKLEKVTVPENDLGINDVWAFKTHKYYKEIEHRVNHLCEEFWEKIETQLEYEFKEQLGYDIILELKEFANIFIQLQALSLINNFAKITVDEKNERIKKKKNITPNDEEFEKLIQMPFFFAELSTAIIRNDKEKLKVLIKEKKSEYEIIAKQMERLGGLLLSNPNEQKLFLNVIKEYENTPIEYKVKPYQIFKKVNDRLNLIPPENIIENGFTKTKLYNRWTQFKNRQQKKSKKP